MHPSRSKWRHAFRVICDRIRTGELAAGDRVPTVHELMQEFSMSNTVAQKVHRALREAGLVETEPGTGSYVLEGAAEKLQAAHEDDD
ncbi:winged helix-turn-helix transcriptional regulator [Nonomuraea turkmeniaca]|uniref:Winged helix-turn-helix transcriptional regulator n=1 Tax=Nonomuraea turkmeniaca TaxID=103838 RepID=A0A5S4FGI1_9ACTN|nr:winged helix-turn-helix domain-containing protein [Nonomuraea turkmeniaca]TMR18548.1 winged helix-turn-helix transcriptional regulator [Nonomuraea turkmeniaca]